MTFTMLFKLPNIIAYERQLKNACIIIIFLLLKERLINPYVYSSDELFSIYKRQRNLPG